MVNKEERQNEIQFSSTLFVEHLPHLVHARKVSKGE